MQPFPLTIAYLCNGLCLAPLWLEVTSGLQWNVTLPDGLALLHLPSGQDASLRGGGCGFKPRLCSLFTVFCSTFSVEKEVASDRDGYV